MLVSGLTVILSGGLAFVLSAPLAKFSYGMFFEKTITATVDAALESQTAQTAGDAIAALLAPNSVLKGLAGLLGFPTQTVAAYTANGSLEEIATAVKTQLIMPAMILLLQILIFIVLFFLFWLLLAIAGNALCRLAKTKTVKGANAVFGALVGVLIGCLFVIGVCLLLNLWLQVNPNGLFGIDPGIREQSVFYLFIHNNLLSL